jgi:hypothetical protein
MKIHAFLEIPRISAHWGQPDPESQPDLRLSRSASEKKAKSFVKPAAEVVPKVTGDGAQIRKAAVCRTDFVPR